MAEPTGLRERNRRERRQRLEDIALELFERDGFDGTTIEQIAAGAGLAPRTFFSYFASKGDLLLSDYEQRLARILDEFDSRPPDERPWDALKAAFAAAAADYEAEADRIRRRFTIIAASPSVLAHSLQLQTGWEQSLAERLSARAAAGGTGAGPRLLAATALAVMRASLQQWLLDPDTAPLPQLVMDSFEQLATGLRPPDRATRAPRRTH